MWHKHHICCYHQYSIWRWFVCFFMLITLISVTSVVQADYANGKDAYDMEEYAIAWQKLLPLAEAGDTEAQILVGRMYNNGNGVTANLSKGAEYYARAATHGNMRAQALLAFLYASGRGVELDHNKALHWYLQSANQGDAYAQLDLAHLYYEGRYIDRDYVQSYKWYFVVSKNDNICDCLLDGKEIVAAKMSSQEIQQAEMLAAEWLQRQSR